MNKFNLKTLQKLLRQKRVKFLFIKNDAYIVNDYLRGMVYLTKNGYKRSENDVMNLTLQVSKFINDVTSYSYVN